MYFNFFEVGINKILNPTCSRHDSYFIIFFLCLYNLYREYNITRLCGRRNEQTVYYYYYYILGRSKIILYYYYYNIILSDDTRWISFLPVQNDVSSWWVVPIQYYYYYYYNIKRYNTVEDVSRIDVSIRQKVTPNKFFFF